MRGKPCAKSMPTPKRTSATGGPTGSFHAQPTSTTKAPAVFQCREWIPDEPIGDVLLRIITEAKGNPLTIKELGDAASASWNTVQKHLDVLIADGVIEAGFVKLENGRGRAKQNQRAFRLKGKP
jgi:DNA-binding transcriptional ArsR family regulator